MADDTPALTRDDVREEAGQTLLALDGSRADRGRFEANWRQLWQLAREASAASLATGNATGPWHLDCTTIPLSQMLRADSFRIPIWPSEEMRAGPNLVRLLNWAGVPIPDARQPFT